MALPDGAPLPFFPSMTSAPRAAKLYLNTGGITVGKRANTHTHTISSKDATPCSRTHQLLLKYPTPFLTFPFGCCDTDILHLDLPQSEAGPSPLPGSGLYPEDSSEIQRAFPVPRAERSHRAAYNQRSNMGLLKKHITHNIKSQNRNSFPWPGQGRAYSEIFL